MRRWRWSMFGDRRSRITPHLRQTIIARDGHRCGYCATTTGPWHIDHITPVALGGATHPANLTVACARCNLSKGPALSVPWLRRLQRHGARVPAAAAVRLLHNYFRQGG